MKRRRMSRSSSNKMFSRGASKTHQKNMPGIRKMPMRGGIRM